MLNNLEQTSSEIITKWEKLGFLVGAKNKRNVGLSCEVLSLYLLENNEKYNGEITTLMIPVINRIFRGVSTVLPIKVIHEKVIEITTSFSDEYNKFKIINKHIEKPIKYGDDIEAEFIKNFCDSYLFVIKWDSLNKTNKNG